MGHANFDFVWIYGGLFADKRWGQDTNTVYKIHDVASELACKVSKLEAYICAI